MAVGAYPYCYLYCDCFDSVASLHVVHFGKQKVVWHAKENVCFWREQKPKIDC